MTPVPETGGVVMGARILRVICDTATPRIIMQTPYPLHVMGINRLYFGG